jgi:hypothetical protein
MSMDPWLAQVYGTASGGEAATDLEKTAQAMFLQKLSAQENVDLSQLSPEQQEQLVQQILAGQQPAVPQGQPQPGQPQQAAPQGQPVQPQGDPSQMDQAQVQELMMKEAQAKFEEADFLGRAMAHAYVNELEKIAEEGKLPAFMQGSGTATDKSSKTSAEPSKSSKEKSKSDKTEKSGTTKTAALVEKLAEARAAEILVANGINPETGAPVEAQGEPPAPQGDAEQQVQAVVDQKAVEMLKAAGYTFQE